MKVIDLLNKIANGEITEDTLIEIDNGYKDYCSVRVLFDRYTVDKENLNCEVEIIEDKKIEKFDPCLGGIMGFDSVEHIFETYKDKINEIIDYINKENK